MHQVATITSKRQLTIPAEMYRRMNFEKLQKVILSMDADGIRIEPALDLVERLAGSLPVPPGFHGRSVDEIVEEAKHTHIMQRAKRAT